MDRGTIKTQIRAYLATESDDPQFSDAILDPLVQESVDSLLFDIAEQNPGWLVKTVTLTTSSASRNYVFATQSAPVTDFKSWLDVRYTDEKGLLLTETRFDHLNDVGRDFFAITGTDDTPTLVLSEDSPAGENIYFRYSQWPVELASDTSTPDEIPSRFHGVIALECLFVFGLGGEQRRPPELRDRWFDRRAQLIKHVGKRGVQPSRSRISADPPWFY